MKHWRLQGGMPTGKPSDVLSRVTCEKANQDPTASHCSDYAGRCEDRTNFGASLRRRLSQPQRPIFPLYLQRHVLDRVVVALVLVVSVISVLGDYVFNEVELANIADYELPLPRPFDATACGLQHLAQHRQLMQALEQLHPQAARQLLQDNSVKAFYEAQQSGLVVEEVQ